MDQFLGFLCGLSVVLLFIAVIGHGIWLFLAFIFRTLFGISPPVESLTPGTRDQSDLPAVRRQMNRWSAEGRLTLEETSKIQELLRTDEQRLSSGAIPFPASSVASSAKAGTSFQEPSIVPSGASQAQPQPPDEPPAHPLVQPPVVHPLDRVEPIYDAEVIDAEAVPSPLAATTSTTMPAAPAPVTPKRALADVLQAFMEESNIRWAEIVSGILIVVSSVGLVVSLRATLKDKIPYFPALSFMLVTAAIHAAGIYSLRQWNLKRTSRGVLIIGTLLVPLNFLASILLSGTGEQQRTLTDPIFLVAVLVGTIAFGSMNYLASRSLLRHGWQRLMIAVLGPSFGQLLINRLTPPTSSPWSATLLLAIPVISFLIATGWLIRQHVRRSTLGRRHVQACFLELGIATFSLLAPVGLFIAKSDVASQALADLSPILSVATCALLALGLMIHRRVRSVELAGYQTAGTTVAVLGGGLLLLMVAFAWPQLELLVAVGLINFVALTALAVLGQLPLLHSFAVGCLAISYLSGFHWWRGIFETVPGSSEAATIRLVQAMFTGPSGLALTVFATLSAIAGDVLRRSKRPEDGHAYWIASAVLSALCVAIAALAGFVSPRLVSGWQPAGSWTPIIFLWFGAAAVFAGWRARLLPATWTGSCLLLAACLQSFCFNDAVGNFLKDQGLQLAHRWTVAFLLHSLVAGGLSLIGGLRRAREERALDTGDTADSRDTADTSSAETGSADTGDSDRRLHSYLEPLIWSAVATSVVATVLALPIGDDRFGPRALYLFLSAIAWLHLARLQSPAGCLSVFQGVATVSVAYAVTAVCAGAGWWRDIYQPQHLQAQTAVLGLWCAGWAIARRLLPAWSWLAKQATQELTVDRVLLTVLAMAAIAMGCRGCAPGVDAEFGMARAAGSPADVAMWLGIGAWCAVACLLLAAAAALWECRSPQMLITLVLVTVAIPLLLSGQWDGQVAVATALRWLFAVFAVSWCVPACYWGGVRSGSSERWLGFPTVIRPADAIRWTSLVPSSLAILGVTTLALLNAAAGKSPGGPIADSLFDRLGNTVSYATPLFVLVAVLLVYGLRERRASYLLFGSFVFQYAMSLACLLPVVSTGAPFDESAWAKLLQWNSVGLAIYAVVWLGSLAGLQRISGRSAVYSVENPPYLLTIQLGVMIAAELLVAGWIACSLFIQPGVVGAATAILGQWPGYLGLAAACGALLWYAQLGFRPARLVLADSIRHPSSSHVSDGHSSDGHSSDGTVSESGVSLAAARSLLDRLALTAWTNAVCLQLLVLVHVVAATLQVRSTAGQWWGHHALAGGRVVLAGIIVGWICWLTQRRQRDERALPARRYATLWASLVLGLAALAAIREVVDDPWRPAWPTGVMIGTSLLTCVLAIAIRRQWYAYAASAAMIAAATLLWLGLNRVHPLRHALGFVALHAIASTSAAGVWLACDLFFQRRKKEAGLSQRKFPPPVQHALGIGSLILLVLYFALGSLAIFASGTPLRVNVTEQSVCVVAWLSLCLFFLLSLWDQRAVYGLGGFYAWTLAVAVFVVRQLTLPPGDRMVTHLAVVATVVALSGWAWSWGTVLAFVGHRIGIPDPIAGLKRTSRWLPPVTILLVAMVGVMSLIVVLSSETRWHRAATACLPLLLGAGTSGMAQQQRRDWMQLLSLMLWAFAGILLGWSDLPPEWTERVVLLRSFRLLMALSALAFATGVIGTRLLPTTSGWRQSARRSAVILSAAAGAVLLGVLTLEFVTFEPGIGAPVEPIQLVAVSIVLLGLVIALLSLAILPERDPLQLTERGRMAYVYAAQVTAGLLFAHIYLARPMLFHGFLRPWWPYIVIALAYAGVGVGELFQRLRLRVLSEPFQRSGAFLPLVPALGMWVVNSDSEYSLVLFTIGVLYMLVSFTQSSPLAGMAAAVAGNGALWSLLRGTEDLTFSQHPQFWLIPPALSALVAAQVNRKRLSETQFVTIRYIAVSVIYLSSTVEMLKIGIGESLWPPVILTILAVAGVFFGIAMRVRAYLYLGAVFVMIGMVSMVAHSARSIQHVWPWWAFILVLGISILVLFGWFEGHRTQMIALVARLRQWEK